MTTPILSSEIKRRDTRPSFDLTLSDDGSALDLTTAQSIRIIGTQAGAVLFEKDVTGTDEGVVTLEWADGDTDVAKDIFVEVEVTWGDGTVQTFPRKGYIKIKVNPDLA